MAAMLRDSVAVLRTRPQTIPVAMTFMKKSTHGFPSLYGAPLDSLSIMGFVQVENEPRENQFMGFIFFPE